MPFEEKCVYEIVGKEPFDVFIKSISGPNGDKDEEDIWFNIEISTLPAKNQRTTLNFIAVDPSVLEILGERLIEASKEMEHARKKWKKKRKKMLKEIRGK